MSENKESTAESNNELVDKSKTDVSAETSGGQNIITSSSKSVSAPKTTGMRLEDLFKLLSMPEPKTEAKAIDDYKFWKTQPVIKFNDSIDAEGPIESNKTVEDVPSEPSPLPTGFEWSTIDITNKGQIQEVYELLYGNFVEDEEESFRLKYSSTFLDWALKPPGWKVDWNVGVRVKDTGKLVGFISGVPGQLRLRTDNPPINVAEINYLCVHKKLRSKRLAPVLIREVTRRVNRTGIWQALYTAGVVLPSPISTTRYYHRSINWPKLRDVGFTTLPASSTAAKQVAKYALPAKQTLETFRPMTADDVPQVHTLLNNYLNRYDLSPIFSEEELFHWLLDSVHTAEEDRVVYSYVVTDPSDKSIITDFVSFYGMESTVLGNSDHDSINVAYLFYYATKEGPSTRVKEDETVDESVLKNRLFILIQNALIVAKAKKFDVFNALSLQDNALFLDDLKFGAGDGFLNYYLFNYKAFPIHGGISKTDRKLERKPGGVGVVML